MTLESYGQILIVITTHLRPILHPHLSGDLQDLVINLDHGEKLGNGEQ